MKKIFYGMAIAAMALLVSCKKDNKQQSGNIDWDAVTEDGFYVAGEATGSSEIKSSCVMVAGINEVDKTARDGMYEKYIVLEGGKEFYLLFNEAGKKTRYSASLEAFETPTDNESYGDNPASVLKGKLVTGDTAPAMKVTKTGLYHIVLDLNKSGDLDAAGGAQIVVLDASNCGVRGDMNGWGFTESDPAVTTFSNDGITWTFKNQKILSSGFKFATGNYWKVTLDDAGKVKAETSLGADMDPKNNITAPEGDGFYDITLTFKLAAGSFAKSFTMALTKVGEVEAPTTLFMIGNQFGGWSWEDAGVVELSAVVPNGEIGEQCFWAMRYFEADSEFKFCTVKEWSGDFGKWDENGNVVGDNNTVPAAGFYTVYVDLKNKVMELLPGELYGIGTAFGENCWDFGTAVKATEKGKVLELATVNASEALRLAVKVKPTGFDNWYDWWRTEFIYFDDGKIVYRGAATSDQDRHAVGARVMLTIDLNAGTVTEH